MPANSARVAGSPEREPGQGLRGERAGQREARHEQRMARHAEYGREEHRDQSLPFVDDGSEHPAPGVGIAAQRLVERVPLEVARQHDAPPRCERVCDRRVGVDPFEPVTFECEVADQRRRQAERVDRGARVVDEPRQRERCRADAAADGVRGLVDPDGAAGARELDRGGEAIRPRPDDDRVELRHGLAVPWVSQWAGAVAPSVRAP